MKVCESEFLGYIGHAYPLFYFYFLFGCPFQGEKRARSMYAKMTKSLGTGREERLKSAVRVGCGLIANHANERSGDAM